MSSTLLAVLDSRTDYVLISDQKVEITIEAMPEDTPIRGNCMASGDSDFDERVALSIEEKLEAGNVWAWCQVKMTAKWAGFEGTEFLGCCSYNDAEDFKNCGGYYVAMRSQALEEMVAQMETTQSALATANKSGLLSELRADRPQVTEID